MKKDLDIGDRIEMIFDVVKRMGVKLTSNDESALAGAIAFHMDDLTKELEVKNENVT